MLPLAAQDAALVAGTPYESTALLTGGLAPDTARDIAWAVSAFAARRAEYALYRAYLEGHHRLTFATRGYREAFTALLAGLRCNVCQRVVHALTDRLAVVGFTGQAGADGSASADAAAAWNFWQAGRFDRISNQIHSEAVALGDAYLLVWPDALYPDAGGRVRCYPYRADEMVVAYDAERPDVIVRAARLWAVGKRYRLNLFYPDRIEKYVTREDAPNGVPDRPTAWTPYAPDPLIRNPYEQVPVFHFAFDAGLGQGGRAELRDVIPLQDALNKTLADLVIASEFGAFRQKYALGVSLDDDDERAIAVGIDRWVTVANADAKVGEFAGTDLAVYTSTIEFFFRCVAQVKGVPLHYLMMSGTFPSGEALKTAEGPLVARVTDTQVDLGDVWEDAIAFALRVTNTATDARIEATWRSAESRAELDHVNAVAIKVRDIGVPEQMAFRELGYSEEEVAAMLTQRKAARQAATQATAQAFNAGQL